MATRRRSKLTTKVTPLRPKSGSFVKPDTKFRLQQERHTLGRGLEIIGVTSASLLLSAGAIMGLIRLGKYQKVQLDRLKEVNREVAAMEARVEIQREKLARAFNPQQSVPRQQGFLQPDEVSIKLVDRNEQSFRDSMTAAND
ncbi:MAG: hypothetical protein CV045_05695 [Cyanobacteria bacterium M5B4]|nr:MAG: hypothetical protein CV045_05695 [Cyanobacteria bacterium M5B4]